MNRLSLWYTGLDRKVKIAVGAGFALVVIVLAAVIGYLVFVPQKVEVKYGTIVRDPVDGHVWSDNTKTVKVDPDQASRYRIAYVDKLSPEHEKELTDAKAREAADAEALANSQGLESVNIPVSGQQVGDMQSLSKNIQSMGSEVVSGMEMAGQIASTKSQLVSYRNQISAVAVPSQLEPTKQQMLQVFDMYIQACDLYLQGIATADMTYIDQANSVANDATVKLQNVLAPAAK